MSIGRAKRILDQCEDVDTVIIINGREPFLDTTFWYAAQLNEGLFESCIAVVKKDGVQLLVSSMEESTARRGKAEVSVYNSSKERDELLRSAIANKERVGLNFPYITLSNAEHLRSLNEELRFHDANGAIEKARSIKDEYELEAIQEACNAASRTAESIPEFVEVGMSEMQLAMAIDARLREEGSEANAFKTIVAFGDNAAHPHHSPGERKLEEGMVLLCDFGAKVRLYCSDLTRTLFLGKPEDDVAKAYAAVAEAQQRGIEAMTPGVPASKPDEIARRVLSAAGLEDRFIHSFGHEIGMSVHEGGVMSQLSNMVLREGMVFSAEPGVYFPGKFGIRVEDTVLMTERGAVRLTKFDRSMKVI